MLRLGLTVFLAALAAAPAAVADTRSSAVVASTIAPPAATLVIAADRDNAPTAVVDLQFRLAPLPADAALASCALRVVLAEAVPGSGNGVLLQLVNTAAPAEPIAAIRVPPGRPKDTAVVLRSRSLCAALQAPLQRQVAGAQADLARFVLQTTIRDGSLSIFGVTPDRPQQIPRLILTYERPGGLGDGDWGQIRHDAGHSGRSAWRMYDPGGAYTPTSSAAAPIPVANVVTDLRQSPLLHRGRIVTVTDLGGGKYRLAAVDRSGAALGQTERGEAPKFLAAGGANRLAYVTENRILLFDPLALATNPVEVPTPSDETMLEPPTIGGDGALYTVTGGYVRGFTPGLIEAWRFRTGHSHVGAVALSEDESTAYVVFGGTGPRLVALDARTGDCRWQQPLGDILHSLNEPMPIPVVAGDDILVTDAFPTGDTLYVVHDTPPQPPADRGELVAPPDGSCRAEAAPRGLTSVGAEDDRIPAHIPAPMAGASTDAYYVRAGALCRGRSRAADAPGEVWDAQCEPLEGCTQADALRITLLIGDSSGGASVGHLYGLAAAAAPPQLFFISPNLSEDGQIAPTCRMQAFDDLGPNLVLAADGTLLNNSPAKRSLLAIVPAAFAAAAQDIDLQPELLRLHDGGAFRTPGTISTAPDLTLPAGADVILVAGGKIVFNPGLRIAEGARLRARVGF